MPDTHTHTHSPPPPLGLLLAVSWTLLASSWPPFDTLFASSWPLGHHLCLLLAASWSGPLSPEFHAEGAYKGPSKAPHDDEVNDLFASTSSCVFGPCQTGVARIPSREHPRGPIQRAARPMSKDIFIRFGSSFRAFRARLVHDRTIVKSVSQPFYWVTNVVSFWCISKPNLECRVVFHERGCQSNFARVLPPSRRE